MSYDEVFNERKLIQLHHLVYVEEQIRLSNGQDIFVSFLHETYQP